MSFAFENLRIAGLRGSVEVRASDPYELGAHVFDRETETLILEGPRTPSHEGTVKFELPPEPGRYRVLVSQVIEGEAWLYERGCPFLLIDATVDGAARLERATIATTRTLQRERFLRALGRAFILPFQTIWRNRSLMRSMVRRDILGRYRGSFAGWFWTVLNPLLLMATYFFVFGIVLGRDQDPTAFALYLIAGMLPWLAFSEAVGRAPANMLEHRTFIKKLRFPVETLPVNLMLSGLVSELFGLVIFTAGFLLARGSVPGTVVWLPVLLIPQMLFTAGLCWFLAALGVFVRDLAQINGFLLTLWFFLTPICYSDAGIPTKARAILTRNPIYVLVDGYRSIFLGGHAPAWGPLWKLWLLAFLVFLAGHAWFYKLRKSFADII